MKPFFSIVTRTIPGREALLERNRASVAAQSIGANEIEHVVLLDAARAGIAAAQRRLWSVSPRGEYVLVLDDDDFLTAAHCLQDLKLELERAQRPEFAVVKVSHGQLGEMPRVWGEGVFPACGEITVSNVVTRHVVWYVHRRNFGEHYAGDYDFIASLFAKYLPAWCAVNVATVEHMRNGATA